ncbi:hypothetical protein CORC01_13640 [Colletotrichum orchidophilum]|uniref:Uncharacterized protein n=1 Tax=Colletotrichum orchidophilum TaxID=1209926 RepID=A0A1G4APV0_9PEZI|nr:uncharacterized protein CORC01_13640 [Colletotrichum orchidophilum]OHE91052.1 hypothetical protein CORC01_13640 [Colletotrichum orchidophilum]
MLAYPPLERRHKKEETAWTMRVTRKQSGGQQTVISEHLPEIWGRSVKHGIYGVGNTLIAWRSSLDQLVFRSSRVIMECGLAGFAFAENRRLCIARCYYADTRVGGALRLVLYSVSVQHLRPVVSSHLATSEVEGAGRSTLTESHRSKAEHRAGAVCQVVPARPHRESVARQTYITLGITGPSTSAIYPVLRDVELRTVHVLPKTRVVSTAAVCIAAADDGRMTKSFGPSLPFPPFSQRIDATAEADSQTDGNRDFAVNTIVAQHGRQGLCYGDNDMDRTGGIHMRLDPPRPTVYSILRASVELVAIDAVEIELVAL